MRTHAVRLHETGGPESLKWEEVEIGDPGPGQVRLVQTAVGVNFIDTYHRTGLYPVSLPTGIGLEAAGRVDAVGEGVIGLKPGDRVAYNSGPLGAYAVARLFPADRLVPLPDWIDDQTAAAMMLRGMTAEYLICRTYPVTQGEWILVHAAAGALGILLCQWARSLGAHVIGTVGHEDKVEIARKNGAEHVLVTGNADWVARVKEITDGAGVPVVYDGVGKATFSGSLDCLRPRGLMVSFGNASGPVPPVDPGELSRRGSLYLTRPTLMHYTATRKDLMESAASLFEVVHREAVKPLIARTFPLRDAAGAHRFLESRQATGSIVLLP
jgi:NADPH2:quinone reductase